MSDNVRMTDDASVDAALADRGWVVVAQVIDAPLIARLCRELDHATENCRRIRERNGLAADADGTAHHLVGQGESFLELLSRKPLDAALRRYFAGPYILNSLGGVTNRREQKSYVGKIHRDLRTFSAPLHLMVNMLVMLDDFTEQNGATWLGSGTHRSPEAPDPARYFSTAERALGRAGDVLLFDSNLWHAAGENTTDQPRRAITPTFTKPFMKQQFDYPRAIGDAAGQSLPEDLRQILGFNSRVPATLDEWYQPPERRFYQAGQG